MTIREKHQNIKDIAKLAGVSHTTVSRVINNSPSVRPSTRRKVMQFIEEIGYTPNIAAKGLISGRTYTIGLLVMYDINQYPSDYLLPSLLEGMTPYLNEHGYSVTLLFNETGGRKNSAAISSINKNRMDAFFILTLDNSNEIFEKTLNIKLPRIFLNMKPQNMDSNFIVADEYGGAFTAVEHLIDGGHRKIGFIGGSPNVTSSIDRKRGYLSALEKHGLEFLPRYERIGYFNMNSGYKAMDELLDTNPDITAVFSANDFMALGAIKAVKDRGMNVPGDIAVVGFDNQDFTEYVEPSITTVKKPRTLMGRLASEKMIDMIEGVGEKYEGIVLPTELIIRASSTKGQFFLHEKCSR